LLDPPLARCLLLSVRMGLVLLIVLLMLVVGGLPSWGYHEYGYGPSSIGGALLLILIILLLTGRI
jgi:hypothetical protein